MIVGRKVGVVCCQGICFHMQKPNQKKNKFNKATRETGEKKWNKEETESKAIKRRREEKARKTTEKPGITTLANELFVFSYFFFIFFIYFFFLLYFLQSSFVRG